MGRLKKIVNGKVPLGLKLTMSFFQLATATVLTVSASQATAHDENPLNLLKQSVVVAPEESIHVHVPKHTYVENLIISAEAVDSHDAMAVLYVNGRERGPIFGPGLTDPTTQYAIDGEVTSIRIQGRSLPGQRGKLKITSIVAEVGESDYFHQSEEENTNWNRNPDCSECDDLPFPTNRFSNIISATANRIKVLIDRLEFDFVNHWDYGDYLLPIKMAATTLEAKAEAAGPYGVLSQEVKKLIVEVICLIDKADKFLLRLTSIKKDKAEKLATEILTLREKLRYPLDK